MPKKKTSSIALLVWRLAAQDELPGDRVQNSGSGHCIRLAAGLVLLGGIM